jgi:hypothetical protein
VQVFFLVGLVFFSLLLAGCSSGGSDSSASGSNQDVSVSNLEYLPSGSIISFNPDIQFSADLRPGSTILAKYTNLSSMGSLPRGSGDVNATLTEESGGVTLEFDFDDKEVKLKLSDFIDQGADGTIDTFKVRLFIDENENSLTYNGSFKGVIKPRSKLSSIPPSDTNRAPTASEFEKFLINKPFFATDYEYNKPDRFTFGENGKLFLWPSNQQNGTYEYIYNNASPKLKINGAYPDGSPFYSELEMSFANFYVGTYKEVVLRVNDQPATRLGSGTFRYYKSSTKALEDLDSEEE